MQCHARFLPLLHQNVFDSQALSGLHRPPRCIGVDPVASAGPDPHNNLVVRVLYGLDPHNNLANVKKGRFLNRAS